MCKTDLGFGSPVELHTQSSNIRVRRVHHDVRLFIIMYHDYIIIAKYRSNIRSVDFRVTNNFSVRLVYLLLFVNVAMPDIRVGTLCYFGASLSGFSGS